MLCWSISVISLCVYPLVTTRPSAVNYVKMSPTCRHGWEIISVSWSLWSHIVFFNSQSESQLSFNPPSQKGGVEGIVLLWWPGGKRGDGGKGGMGDREKIISICIQIFIYM